MRSEPFCRNRHPDAGLDKGHDANYIAYAGFLQCWEKTMAQRPDTKTPEWGFYGRVKELEELSDYLHIHPTNDVSRFQCTAITGRRGVGKNALLEECMTLYDRSDRLILFELPGQTSADIPAVGEEVDTYDLRVRNFIREEMASRGMSSLLDDLPECKRSDKYPAGEICNIIEHLVYKDYIVALDEVHNCADYSRLPGHLKMLIDRLTRKKNGVLKATGEPPPTGQLVLMGSHQQKFQKMRRGDQPLGGGRIEATVLVRPWRMETILDVVREHGWDRRPRRFLTLWTAFGGLPREWERFAQLDGPSAHLAHGWPPLTGDHARDYKVDQGWHRDFVAHAERHLRNDADLRWDNAAFIDLPPATAQILCLMGLDVGTVKMQSPLAIQKRMDAELVLPVWAIRKELKHFMDDLDVVGSQDMYTGPSGNECLWYMKDNTALFQMALAPDLFHSTRRARRDWDAPQPTPGKAVADLEGIMLERWIREMLAYHPGVIMNICSAKPLDSGQADIDGLVRVVHPPGQGVSAHDRSHDRLLCINAKRQGMDHDIDKFQTIVDDFMDPVHNPDSDVNSIRWLARRHLFVSPQISPKHRQEIHEAGHLALDIPDLVRDMRDGWPVINRALAVARRPAPPAVPAGTVAPAKPKGPS